MPLPQGGVADINLETLSVEGVCEILTRLEGIQSDNTQEYMERLKYNNINGVVLYNCELQELKVQC